MRELELKTEIKLLKFLVRKSGNGRVNRSDIKHMIDLRVDELLNLTDMKIESMKERRLSDFNLSTRALNCMKVNDICTVGELIERWPLKLQRSRNYGPKTEKELKYFLIENKLIKL